jgi:hypothetical protein
MPNPFLEGAPHNQMMRLFEFAANFHLNNESQPAFHWLELSHDDAIDRLEDAFFDSCVATQSCVVKAMTLMHVYDDYPGTRVIRFIERARRDPQAPTITEALDKLAAIVRRPEYPQESSKNFAQDDQRSMNEMHVKSNDGINYERLKDIVISGSLFKLGASLDHILDANLTEEIVEKTRRASKKVLEWIGFPDLVIGRNDVEDVLENTVIVRQAPD